MRRMRDWPWPEPQSSLTVAMMLTPKRVAILELRLSINNQTSRMTNSLEWVAHMWRDATTPRICAWVVTIAAGAPRRPGHALTRTRLTTRRASVRTVTWPIIIVSARLRIWRHNRSLYRSNKMPTRVPNLQRLTTLTSPRALPRSRRRWRRSPPTQTAPSRSIKMSRRKPQILAVKSERNHTNCSRNWTLSIFLVSYSKSSIGGSKVSEFDQS